ncbi:MAG: hypothetical protein IT371_24055 [Deltaproteobacteria bacterium]|nr:hypothetical protein [Deltaproteobacteria bacterium]
MSRLVFYALLSFLALTALTPIYRLFGLESVQVDVPLLVVLHLAFVDRRGAGQMAQGTLGRFGGRLDGASVLCVLLLGYLTDLLGGGMKGIHLFSLALVYLAGCMLARQVYVAGALSAAVIAAFASVASSLTALVVRWATGVPPSLGVLTVVLGQAALTAVFAPPLLRLLAFGEQRLSRKSVERSTLQPS